MVTQSGQRGQVLPLAAIVLTVLMGFGGFAVDLGYVQYQQRQQQSATDAAAVAGAQALIANNVCPDNGAAITAAQGDAATNGFQNGIGGVTVTAGAPTSGPFKNDGCAVQATVTSAQNQTWFSKLFGFSGAVTTTAVATVENDGDPGAIALDPSGSNTLDDTSIKMPTAGILINGNVTFSGGTIDAKYVDYAGTSTVSGTSFKGGSPTKMLPVADPCPGIAGCAYLTKNAPAAPAATASCSNLTISSKSSYTIPAGCYNEITITNSNGVSFASGTIDVGTLNFSNSSGTLNTGDYGTIETSGNSNLTFDPGLYVISNSTSFNGANITASGVTFYAYGSGSMNFEGSMTTLSPCTTSCENGAVANMLYFQPPGNASAAKLDGGCGGYTGIIYAPSAPVTLGDISGGTYSVIVGGTLNFPTGNTLTNSGPSTGQSYIKNAVLAL
jgi:Flp pilus assembly protein TadG